MLAIEKAAGTELGDGGGIYESSMARVFGNSYEDWPAGFKDGSGIGIVIEPIGSYVDEAVGYNPGVATCAGARDGTGADYGAA
jgi:hypothetical protein